jgi:bla regulator protein blaR1
MTAITDLFTGGWANTFGWTLFHSLWQSAAILLLVQISLRVIPASRSGVRYAVACGGLLLLILGSLVTFISLADYGLAAVPGNRPIHGVALTDKAASGETSAIATAVTHIGGEIQQNMPAIILLWLSGFIFFALRLAGGLLYTHRLKANARPLKNEWDDYIRHLAGRLGIGRLISLAESSAVTTPMVIGYLKPVVLIPTAMLTGLSGEQLEMIFLHELAHIRRHDYLMNVLQSIVEIIFFFNPFVWLISGLIRREREFCCDDLVVREHGSARSYAHALAQLAEIRHTSAGFAIALVGDKNQLLNRIRRIMEKSFIHHPRRNRILVPAILLVSALLCISWLGIQEHRSPEQDSLIAEQDTILPEKENTARYSRRSIITIDKNGEPHEEIIEEFEGDESLRPLLKNSIPDISALAPPPPPGFMSPVLPQLPAMPDTIPLPRGLGDEEQWEAFSKAFEENFRMNFDSLFSLRHHDASRLMEKLEQFGLQDWPQSFDFSFPHGRFEDLENGEVFKELQEELRQFRELNMDHFKHFKDFGIDSALHRGGRYQDALREALVEDGYLSQGEQIESLEWSDETFKVNGKEIKPADEEKYRALNQKFFNRRPLETF